MNTNNIKGVGASSGVAIAKTFLLETPNINLLPVKNIIIKDEIKKYQNALSKTKKDILKIKELSLEKLGADKALIFEAHIQILEDVSLNEDIINKITNEKMDAANSINKAFDTTKSIFEKMDNEYFKERASDIEDLRIQMLANVQNIKLPNILLINEEVILVAKDLTPSQTALLNKKFIKGFLVDVGGRTSHAAIMARTMEIPAVLGLGDITSKIKNGCLVAMNGDTGEVEIDPKNVSHWNELKKRNANNKIIFEKYIPLSAKTKDGKRILIEANIGKPADVKSIDSYGAEGVGLYRSEFLYMENSKWPTEDEQFHAYKTVLENQKDKLVVVRTLDIGGDKNLPYYKFPKEENPFLGYRAIRFCLDNKDIFKVQLRALARASNYGQLGIMFPMIATIDEFKEAKEFTLNTIEELKKEGQKISNDIKIGMMIEIPSSAILANQFAKYADFFSIGTNDLIQYSFAVDRMSQDIKYLYQPNNPSLLKLIRNVIVGAEKNNCHVAMCGEMAGEVLSIPILIGLNNKGLDALSMSATSIPKVKYLISQLDSKECAILADQAIQLETEYQVNELVKKFLEQKKLIV
ncbi:MAG: phosphoenolpyruvate--protein phosphotransferase [Mycoplasmoidaceae bacterium]